MFTPHHTVSSSGHQQENEDFVFLDLPSPFEALSNTPTQIQESQLEDDLNVSSKRPRLDSSHPEPPYDYEYDPSAEDEPHYDDDGLLDDPLIPTQDLVQWTLTSRGKKMLILAGYPFWNKGYTNKHKTRVRYTCNTDKCKTSAYASVVASGDGEDHFLDISVDKLPSHNHAPPQDNSFWQRYFYKMLYDKLMSNKMLPAQQIYRSALVDIPSEIQDTIPSFERYRSSIYRYRREVIPKDPATALELDLTPEICTPTGKNILLINEVRKGIRYVALGTLQNLAMLTQKGTIYADGTFRSSPKIFKQIYGLHMKKHGFGRPLLLFFLQGKSKEIYITMWNLLSEKCQAAFGRPLSIGAIYLDFEQAMIKAIVACLPSTTISLCLFHWGSTLYKNLCEKGLKTFHASNTANLRDYFDCLRALPLIPIMHLPFALDSLTRLAVKVTASLPPSARSNFRLFEQYFIKTFVGVPSRPPIFDSSMWNHAGSTERTSNLAEAYHHTLNNLISVRHPGFYHILLVITDQYDEYDRLFHRLQCGDNSRKPTNNRKECELTLERAYNVNFPEYCGTPWHPSPVQLPDVQYITYLRTCSAALTRARGSQSGRGSSTKRSSERVSN